MCILLWLVEVSPRKEAKLSICKHAHFLSKKTMSPSSSMHLLFFMKLVGLQACTFFLHYFSWVEVIHQSSINFYLNYIKSNICSDDLLGIAIRHQHIYYVTNKNKTKRRALENSSWSISHASLQTKYRRIFYRLIKNIRNPNGE